MHASPLLMQWQNFLKRFIVFWTISDSLCRAEGALTFECQRRTRSTWFFVCPRNANFGIFWIFWIFPGGNEEVHRRSRRYHWPCSCSLDSLRCVSSHWSCQKRFGRPKLKLHRRKIFQNPILAKYAPDWDFAQILVHFLKILIFAALVVATTP